MTYVYLFGEREVRNLKILMEQGVGVVVVSTLGRQATCIGSPATHTVYAVELQGIEMVLTQIYKSIGPATQCPDQTCIGIISTDNQAAIQACAAPRRSSGQYILHQISQLAGCSTMGTWVEHTTAVAPWP